MLEKNETLDGLDDNSDVWVGRASTASAAQAAGFVDKVMTYERLCKADDTPVDTGYLQKNLYAADWWGKIGLSKQKDTSIPPAEDCFTYVDGATQLKIHNHFTIPMLALGALAAPTYRLVGITGTTRIVVPFNYYANSSTLGWFLCTNDDYTTQSFGQGPFVMVCGPAADLDQDSYLWDPVGLEGGAKEKEAMRALMNWFFPGFTTVERFYFRPLRSESATTTGSSRPRAPQRGAGRRAAFRKPDRPRQSIRLPLRRQQPHLREPGPLTSSHLPTHASTAEARRSS